MILTYFCKTRHTSKHVPQRAKIVLGLVFAERCRLGQRAANSLNPLVTRKHVDFAIFSVFHVHLAALSRAHPSEQKLRALVGAQIIT